MTHATGHAGALVERECSDLARVLTGDEHRVVRHKVVARPLDPRLDERGRSQLAAGAVHAQTVILYAHTDRQAVDRLRAFARIYGPVWTDADIPPGTPWRADVGRRVREARVVLLVWSAAAAASVEVSAEWRQAIAAGRRVVPVLLDAEPLPAELGRLQWVDAGACTR